MKKLVLIAALSSLAFAQEAPPQTNCWKDVCLGKERNGSNEVYCFTAREVLYKNKPIGWSNRSLQPISETEIVFKSCNFDERERTGPHDYPLDECGQWMALNISDGSIKEFSLPEFDHYWSGMSFRPPYIAYWTMKMPVSERRGGSYVGAAIYDWNKQSLVESHAIGTSCIGTDMPFLPAPRWKKIKGGWNVIFEFEKNEDCEGKDTPLYYKASLKKSQVN